MRTVKPPHSTPAGGTESVGCWEVALAGPNCYCGTPESSTPWNSPTLDPTHGLGWDNWYWSLFSFSNQTSSETYDTAILY